MKLQNTKKYSNPYVIVVMVEEWSSIANINPSLLYCFASISQETSVYIETLKEIENQSCEKYIPYHRMNSSQKWTYKRIFSRSSTRIGKGKR